jgi:hypothetical protein
MGRALDNAMLNVGLKDVARGTSTDAAAQTSLLMVFQLASRIWAFGSRTLSLKNTMLLSVTEGWAAWLRAFSTVSLR